MSFDGELLGTPFQPSESQVSAARRRLEITAAGFALWAWVAQEDDMLRIALPHIALGPSSPSFACWREALQVWRRREQERSELARMTETELHDIGVTSAERWAEINKPFWRG